MTTPERVSTGTRLGVIAGFILMIALIVISIAGYTFEWKWTGLPATENNGPKTLWDWLDLLIIPAVLGVGALWFSKVEADAEVLRAERNAQLEHDIENQRAQEAAMEAYLDRMSTLLLDKKLGESEPGSPVHDLARTRTLTVLRRLEADKRNITLRFLRDAKLLGKGKETSSDTEDRTIALLSSATMSKMNMIKADLINTDLSGTALNAANLSKAFLFETNLSKAFLFNTNLSGTFLNYANLSDSDLRYANLSGAFLSYANLSNSDLRIANLSGADLMKVDLCGAKLSAANLMNTYLDGADLSGANLLGVNNLSCKQLRMAKNWEHCYRDEALACGAPIPKLPPVHENGGD